SPPISTLFPYTTLFRSNEIRNREGVTLVSVEPEYDFNRTVLTILGEPEPLKEALIAMAGKSYELIDMREQEGSHPRIGGQDTIRSEEHTSELQSRENLV